MSRLHRVDSERFAFHCPGCECAHVIPVTGEHAWQWNESIDAPTFRPSILVTYPANPNALEEFKEWRTERRCHSFVSEGKIEFLSDCTHALAGQTVEIPDWEAI